MPYALDDPNAWVNRQPKITDAAANPSPAPEPGGNMWGVADGAARAGGVIERPLPEAQVQYAQSQGIPTYQNRTLNVGNNNYNMPGSYEAWRNYGVPPVMTHGRDPYARIAFSYGPSGPVPLMGFPSVYPHVLNSGYYDYAAPYMARAYQMAGPPLSFMDIMNGMAQFMKLTMRGGGGTGGGSAKKQTDLALPPVGEVPPANNKGGTNNPATPQYDEKPITITPKLDDMPLPEPLPAPKDDPTVTARQRPDLGRMANDRDNLANSEVGNMAGPEIYEQNRAIERAMLDDLEQKQLDRFQSNQGAVIDGPANDARRYLPQQDAELFINEYAKQIEQATANAARRYAEQEEAKRQHLAKNPGAVGGVVANPEYAGERLSPALPYAVQSPTIVGRGYSTRRF